MVIGSEVRASTQLQMMQRQISLWKNQLDQNVDLLKTLNADDRCQLNYMLNVVEDHLAALSMRIVS